MQYLLSPKEYETLVSENEVLKSRVTTLNRIHDEMGSKIASLNKKIVSLNKILDEKKHLSEENETLKSKVDEQCSRICQLYFQILDLEDKLGASKGSDFDIDKKKGNFKIVGHLNDDGTITRY